MNVHLNKNTYMDRKEFMKAMSALGIIAALPKDILKAQNHK